MHNNFMLYLVLYSIVSDPFFTKVCFIFTLWFRFTKVTIFSISLKFKFQIDLATTETTKMMSNSEQMNVLHSNIQ